MNDCGLTRVKPILVRQNGWKLYVGSAVCKCNARNKLIAVQKASCEHLEWRAVRVVE
jgi:hypothetical protein